MLKDKIAIITGASRGLGFTTGKLFLKEGAKIVVNGRNEESLRFAWHDNGENVLIVPGDISSEETVKNIFHLTMEKFGTVDILINNASIPHLKKLVDTTLQEWEEVFAVNVRGTFLMTREAVDIMIKNKIKGKIVNIASVSGKVASPMLAAYSSSKAAVIGFTRTVAKEIVGNGINVNSICPGPMDTDMFHKGTVDAVADMYKQPREEVLKKILSSVPMKRMLSTEEVSELILYLSSQKADSITGQSLNIDCGYDMN